MDEEIRFHIERETERNMAAGMSLKEARRRALIDFGGVERHRAATRQARFSTRWTSLFRFLPGTDGVPHVEHGMALPFEVS